MSRDFVSSASRCRSRWSRPSTSSLSMSMTQIVLAIAARWSPMAASVAGTRTRGSPPHSAAHTASRTGPTRAPDADHLHEALGHRVGERLDVGGADPRRKRGHRLRDGRQAEEAELDRAADEQLHHPVSGSQHGAGRCDREESARRARWTGQYRKVRRLRARGVRAPATLQRGERRAAARAPSPRTNPAGTRRGCRTRDRSTERRSAAAARSRGRRDRGRAVRAQGSTTPARSACHARRATTSCSSSESARPGPYGGPPSVNAVAVASSARACCSVIAIDANGPGSRSRSRAGRDSTIDLPHDRPRQRTQAGAELDQRELAGGVDARAGDAVARYGAFTT